MLGLGAAFLTGRNTRQEPVDATALNELIAPVR